VPTTIGIIEDDRITSDLLAAVCEREFRAAVVVQEPAGIPGLKALRAKRPKLVILDISLPDIDGLDLARVLLAERPQIRIMVMSALRDPLTMSRVRELGVPGFVDKREQSVTMLKSAISAVLAGNSFHAPIMAEVLGKLQRDPLAFYRVLSSYEQEILMLIGNALSDDEIAALMKTKPATAQSRRRDIMTKLRIHSTPKLIQYANEMGFSRLGRYRLAR
jgi:DNA-binding NarL/FixJ family response regulator